MGRRFARRYFNNCPYCRESLCIEADLIEIYVIAYFLLLFKLFPVSPVFISF